MKTILMLAGLGLLCSGVTGAFMYSNAPIFGFIVFVGGAMVSLCAVLHVADTSDDARMLAQRYQLELSEVRNNLDKLRFELKTVDPKEFEEVKTKLSKIMVGAALRGLL